MQLHLFKHELRIFIAVCLWKVYKHARSIEELGLTYNNMSTYLNIYNNTYDYFLMSLFMIASAAELLI